MIEIGRLPLDDAVGVGLVRALHDDLDERYGAEDDGGAAWFAEVTADKVRPPDGVFLVAMSEGDAIGCGALKRIDSTTGEIKRMYTSPTARRRGVGRALLAELERAAAELGYRALKLETGLEQPEAVALYEAAGWSRIPPYGRYRDDPRSVCFQKLL